MVWIVWAVLLEGRSTGEDEEECDESKSDLGSESGGEKGGSCRLQAYTVWHDEERQEHGSKGDNLYGESHGVQTREDHRLFNRGRKSAASVPGMREWGSCQSGQRTRILRQDFDDLIVRQILGGFRTSRSRKQVTVQDDASPTRGLVRWGFPYPQVRAATLRLRP